jgi:hypothetical protein
MANPEIPRNYYAVLGLKENADEAAIRSSYKRLAKLRHPDKNPHDPNATAEFQLVSQLGGARLYTTVQYISSTNSRYPRSCKTHI